MLQFSHTPEAFTTTRRRKRLESNACFQFSLRLAYTNCWTNPPFISKCIDTCRPPLSRPRQSIMPTVRTRLTRQDLDTRCGQGHTFHDYSSDLIRELAYNLLIAAPLAPYVRQTLYIADYVLSCQLDCRKSLKTQ